MTAMEDAGDTFDFIVTGAGSAGCAVAGRLSESGRHRVLLLEAGGRDRSLNIKIPAAFPKQFHTKLDWDYATEPEPHVDGRCLYIPRGSVDISIELKLHGDIRTAELAERGHLRYAGDSTEHAFKWGRNRGGHRFGACTGQIRIHGDGRVLDLRQRSQWKKGKSQRTEEEQTHAQQGCRHRPPNKRGRNIHSYPPLTSGTL